MHASHPLPQSAPAGAPVGAPLVILKLEGLAVLALAIFLFHREGGPWWLFVVLLLAPDLSMFGYMAGPKVGAVCYNAAHTYLLPAILGGIGLAAGASLAVQLALIWTAHIGLDRLLGYGLKYPGSFGQTHLGGKGNETGQISGSQASSA